MALRQLRYNGWPDRPRARSQPGRGQPHSRRAGLNRLRPIDPPPPVVRYEHKRPGDLIHFDSKRLARIVQPGHRVHGDRARETQTALREGAYARSLRNSGERTGQLDSWLHDYTFHRPPASLNLNTPASRAGLNRNNLLSLHS